jgi:EmrB/QacA subfamily drug resistance transporter
VLTVLCVAVFLVVVDNTIVNVALPILSEQLHSSNSGLQWIVDGYSLPFAGLLLAGAEVADRFGRLRVMNGALVSFALWSLLAATSHSMTQLLIARALLGASAAFIFPATLSLVTVAFDHEIERAKAFGIWGATAGVAIALGPIVGGYLLNHFWFGSIFLINIPVALVALALTWWHVGESSSPVSRGLDWPGLIFGSVAVSALVFAIIEGPSWGWLTSRILVLFGLSLVLGVLFVRYEHQRDEPLLDVRLFRRGPFSAGAAAIAASFFSLFGFIFYVTQYFQMVRGYSAFSSGLHTLPFAVVTMIATPFSAVIALRAGIRWVVGAGLVIMGSAMILIASFSAHVSYFVPIVGAMSLFGVGFSLITPTSTAAVMSTLSPSQIGSGAAVNETTRELGGTLGVAVMGSVFASYFSQRIASNFHHLRLTSFDIDRARGSMQAALRTVEHVPVAQRSATVGAVQDSFMNAFHRTTIVGGLVAIVVGVTVAFWLPSTPMASPTATPTDGTSE